MLVNKVMSNQVESQIFTALHNYFKRFCDCEFTITDAPDSKADVYHYHRPNLERSLQHPCVITVHHDLEDSDPWFSLENFLDRYKEADHVVCLNKTQQEHLNLLGVSQTSVIPHGYDQHLFKKRPLKQFDPGRKITLGIVSKRYKRRVKGETTLFELAKRLDSEKFRFILVGDGRCTDALMLTEFGFETEVYESLPYALYSSVYDEMDFLLMLSFFEGGPANIPEALAKGVPVLTTPIAMAKDMIEEEKNGLFLQGSHTHMAKKIERVLEQSCYEKLQHFLQQPQPIQRWEEVIKAYESLYESLGGRCES